MLEGFDPSMTLSVIMAITKKQKTKNKKGSKGHTCGFRDITPWFSILAGSIKGYCLNKICSYSTQVYSLKSSFYVFFSWF